MTTRLYRECILQIIFKGVHTHTIIFSTWCSAPFPCPWRSHHHYALLGGSGEKNAQSFELILCQSGSTTASSVSSAGPFPSSHAAPKSSDLIKRFAFRPYREQTRTLGLNFQNQNIFILHHLFGSEQWPPYPSHVRSLERKRNCG